MKIPTFRPLLIAGLAITVAGCSSSAPAVVSTPIENIDTMPLKVTDLTETELKGWGGADLVSDTIPGMSVQKAYSEIIKNTKGKKVIVAVIDSGVDIEHEDLDGVIWTNEDEVPGNNKDDDNNGYVDDIHGWNFLGDAVKENMEYVRIYKKLKPKYNGIPASAVKPENKEEFDLYMSAKAEYEKEYNEALGLKNQYEGILQQLKMAHDAVSTKLGKEDYTLEELQAMKAETEEMKQYKGFLFQVMSNVEGNIPDAIAQLNEAIDYFSGRLDSHFNLELDGRAIVGDDVNDINDTNYGNNDVTGPTPDKEDIKHGTHVAGIIAAERNNNRGINGVAHNVEIMPIRAVPDGDEYDKDIALAIRYAVDNGASIINTSFGKYFSTHPEWVIDAIQYAEKNDVLVVNAAGNEGLDLDQKRVYPNDQTPEDPKEIANNVLTVGALNYTYGSNMIASFSNYGASNVDVFAPGTQIWSTTPNNEYEFMQGTSMAAPAVTGVAAVIRSLYPKLSARQVKKVIMDGGLSSSATVVLGGDPSNTKNFGQLSTSGKMANMYNALILADKLSR
ncbi:Subtilase family protein [Salinimicrobium catena]|uniref:Subtilase family protein n=1 Tax=Salinimicrobium catena TaxID=390640 RepID=A0A1H5IL65_9FLAO|nr:S8 family peptidase [Salinimicrobium catena]SDK78614.1 Subtilase family protein [Salinimicrobium catena]SEE40969.1 Subtilase family protein [Salinimicrobium catena]